MFSLIWLEGDPERRQGHLSAWSRAAWDTGGLQESWKYGNSHVSNLSLWGNSLYASPNFRSVGGQPPVVAHWVLRLKSLAEGPADMPRPGLEPATF